ncbi:hypothetical protein [Litchfieldella rifensis]|uniref:Uncharacterized protein n=1 Tax=Litchfieldella rifensis TaxID=762643 RepID=A0ABV7LUN5_9GAMM
MERRGGAFVVSTLALGVAEGDIKKLLYIPLAIACWVSPVIGLLYAQFGLFSPRSVLPGGASNSG